MECRHAFDITTVDNATVMSHDAMSSNLVHLPLGHPQVLCTLSCYKSLLVSDAVILPWISMRATVLVGLYCALSAVEKHGKAWVRGYLPSCSL